MQQTGSIGQPSTTRTPSAQTDSSDLHHSGNLHMTPIPSMYISGNIFTSRPAVNAQNPYHMNISTSSPLSTTSNMYSSAASLSSASSQGATAHNLSQSPSSTTHTSGAVHRENRAPFTAMTGSRSAPYAYVDQSNAYASAGPGMPSGSDAFTGSHVNRLDVSAGAEFTGLQTQSSLTTTFVPASSFPTDIGSSQYESGFIDPTELARRYDLDAIAERERASAERAMTASRSFVKASASPGFSSLTKLDTAPSQSQLHPSQGNSLQFITEDPTSMARVVSNSLSHHRIDPQARLRDTNKSPCARCKRSHIKVHPPRLSSCIGYISDTSPFH